MKHFKKIISLLMTVVLIVSMVSVFTTTSFAAVAPSSFTSSNYYVDKSVSSTVDVAAATVANFYVTRAEFTCNGVTKVTFDGIAGPDNYTQATTFDVSSWAVGDYTLTYHVHSANYYGVIEIASDDDYAYATIHVSCSHQKKTATGTVSPTCTVDGYTLYNCPSCGKTGIKDNIVTASHNIEWRTISPATTKSPGTKEKYCTVCKSTFGTEEIPKIEYVFEKRTGSTVMTDAVRGLLYGIEENTSSLEPYFFISNNCSLQYSKPVGTGTNVKVMVGSELTNEYDAVVFGDTTGDGIVDSFDVASLASVVNFESAYDTIALNEAADIYDDGYVDNIDLTFLIAAANCDITLDQRGEIDPSITRQYSYIDYQYGPYGERNLLDLRIPEGAFGEMGLILYIHGGTWLFGSKADMQWLANDGFAHGYAVASVNYRYADALHVNCGTILNDIQTAVGVIKQLGAQSGVTFNKMMVVGYSAGGHLALMYGYTRVGSSPITPVAVWDRSGPADLSLNEWLSVSSLIPSVFTALSGYMIESSNFNTTLAQYALKDISPAYKVNSGTVPTIISHGTNDNIVPYKNAIVLAAALQNSGVKFELYPYAYSTHGLEDQSAENQARSTFYSWCNEYIGAPYAR